MISDINEGSRIPVALRYTDNAGFETAYEAVETDSLELRDDVAITRIDLDIAPPEDGSIGIGLTEVKQINRSSSGEMHYLILELVEFDVHSVEKSTERSNHDVRSHVDRSHRDTATIRATSGLQNTNITR